MKAARQWLRALRKGRLVATPNQKLKKITVTRRAAKRYIRDGGYL